MLFNSEEKQIVQHNLLLSITLPYIGVTNLMEGLFYEDINN